MNDTIHRDVFKPVMEEFNRLKAKQPNASTDVLMKFAKEYVRALATADSVRILQMVRETR